MTSDGGSGSGSGSGFETPLAALRWEAAAAETEVAVRDGREKAVVGGGRELVEATGCSGSGRVKEEALKGSCGLKVAPGVLEDGWEGGKEADGEGKEERPAGGGGGGGRWLLEDDPSTASTSISWVFSTVKGLKGRVGRSERELVCSEVEG